MVPKMDSSKTSNPRSICLWRPRNVLHGHTCIRQCVLCAVTESQLNESGGPVGESAVQIKQWVLITGGLSEGSLAEWILMGLVREMKRHCPRALHQHITTGNDSAGNGGGRDSSIPNFTRVTL